MALVRVLVLALVLVRGLLPQRRHRHGQLVARSAAATESVTVAGVRV
jgi:hypothetical protein